MPTAFIHLPVTDHYRRDAFIKGFARLGYKVVLGQSASPLRKDDVAVIWNRTARSHLSVQQAKVGGGALIVLENGYYGADHNGHQFYAMALDGHCGSGRWYAPDDSRLKALDIDFKPWRSSKVAKLLVAAQRGIGSAFMRSPANWDGKMHAQFKYRHETSIRTHPGPDKDANGPLMDSLPEDTSLIVWSSNCATEALINGVPTYYAAPAIITRGAAAPLAALGRHTFTDEARYEAFSRLAWAQWSLEEIESSEALSYLIDVHHGKLPSIQEGLGL